MKIFFLFFFNLLIVVCLKAQKNENSHGLEGYSFSAKYMGGKMLKHTKKIYLPPPAYSQALELSISKKAMGKTELEQRTNYPTTALNFCITQYGSTLLGTAYSLYPSLQMNLLNKKKIRIYTEIGGGIGYITKHWDRLPQDDTMNNIVGSHLNNFTMLELGLHYQYNLHWGIELGGSFSHISNGTARQPNFGINIMGLHVAANYYPVSAYTTLQKSTLSPIKNSINVGMRLAYSITESLPTNGPIYSVYSCSIYATRMYKNKMRWMLGMDATYNKKMLAIEKNSYLHVGNEKKYAWSSTAFIGNDFLLGRISIPLQIGVYVKQLAFKHSSWYQKLGISYHYYRNEQTWIKDAAFSTILKTHISNAEYIEFCTSFLF